MSLFNYSKYKVTNIFRQIAFWCTLTGAITITIYPDVGMMCFSAGISLCFFGTVFEKIYIYNKDLNS